MRFVLVLLAAIAVLAVSRPASADTSSTEGWASPAVAIALLDGFRSPSGQIDLKVKHAAREQASPQTTDKDRTVDPGEELSAAVERMWSQVRAYRRPGGAEFILRGKFWGGAAVPVLDSFRLSRNRPAAIEIPHFSECDTCCTELRWGLRATTVRPRLSRSSSPPSP